VGPFEAAALGDAGAVRGAIETVASGARMRLRDGTTLLHVAASREVADMLIAAGADLDVENAYRGHPIDSALARAAIGPGPAAGVVEALIAAGAEVDATTLAAAGDLERLARDLEGAPDNLDRAGRTGRPPLLEAAAHGRFEVVRWLLERGADPNACDREGVTALHVAASTAGHAVEIARALIAAGAALDARDGLHDATPASWAEFQRKPELQRLLRSAESGGAAS
jgi:ankyrin repeat protein